MAYKTRSALPVVEGGTGQITLTQHGLLVGNATSGITQLGVASTGQTLMGVTGNDPSFTGSPSFSGSVTAGTSIVASSGNITATSGQLVATSVASNDFIGILTNNVNDAFGGKLALQKERAGATITTGDVLFSINYRGFDGSVFRDGAIIRAQSTGTISSRIPANLLFFTQPDSAGAITQRMSIASTGAVTIATPDSGTGLTVTGGGITCSAGAITATSGNVVISAGNLTLPATTSSSLGVITMDGNRFIHAYGLTTNHNTFVGQNSGNFTLNTTLALENTGYGYLSLNGLTTGSVNVAVGAYSLYQLTTGNRNFGLGYAAGSAYTTSESDNICVGYNVVGTLGESHVIRFGTDGTGTGQQSSFNTVRNFTSATAGAGITNTLTVSNTDNTNAASNTIIKSVTGGASAGDGAFQASTTTTTWTFGVDNSVTSPTADPFVIAQGTALGTNNVMSIDTAGAINYPLQPAFLAYLNTTDLNVTGNAAVYTVGTNTAMTKVFDQGTNFNTNGTFTAPVTGRYQLSGAVGLTGNTSLNECEIMIVTSNRTYYNALNRAGGNTDINQAISALADMDAADVANLIVVGKGEAGNTSDLIGVVGGTQLNTFFSGILSA